MEANERIEINPKVCNGKPVIRGTRIPVAVVLDHLAEGFTYDEIIAEYPELGRDDIASAVAYARAYIENSEVTIAG